MKTAIVIPCKDTRATLPRVLAEIPAALHEGVIVVDDGSDPPIDAPGVRLVRHTRNRGYGAAQKSGYATALEAGAEVVVLLHGDGQYDTAETLALATLAGVADVALGSRFLRDKGRGIPAWRRHGNQLLTGLANIRFERELSELHTGARAFRADALRALPLSALSDDYAFDHQLLMAALARGMSFAEGPVRARYDDSVQSITFSRSVAYGLACLRSMVFPAR